MGCDARIVHETVATCPEALARYLGEIAPLTTNAFHHVVSPILSMYSLAIDRAARSDDFAITGVCITTPNSHTVRDGAARHRHQSVIACLAPSSGLQDELRQICLDFNCRMLRRNSCHDLFEGVLHDLDKSGVELRHKHLPTDIL